jgi:hypothetical protein
MKIKCADCGCFPEDCKRSKSNEEFYQIDKYIDADLKK